MFKAEKRVVEFIEKHVTVFILSGSFSDRMPVANCWLSLS